MWGAKKWNFRINPNQSQLIALGQVCTHGDTLIIFRVRIITEPGLILGNLAARSKYTLDDLPGNTYTHLFVVLVDVAVSKLFPAQLALIWFVLAVDDFMSCHLVQALKAAVADLTSIGSLLWWPNTHTYKHTHAQKKSCSWFPREVFLSVFV